MEIMGSMELLFKEHWLLLMDFPKIRILHVLHGLHG
jgi:hypothetical protein